MAEMMGVTVTAGGSVTRQTWTEFMADMAQTGFEFTEIVVGRLFFADEANYGDTGEVREACTKHGIAVRTTCDAKYEYSGDTTVWFPGMEAERNCLANQDGEAVVRITHLKDFGSLDQVLASYEPFLRPIPPMLIDGKPVTKTDLPE